MGLSGCGWTLAEVRPSTPVQGNKDELRIYTWSSYIDDTLIDRFKTQTGIRAVPDIFNSNETMLATFQAGKAATYSIIYPSDYKVAEMIEKKYLSELDHSRINGLENILPKFQNPVYDPSNRHSIPVSWGTTGFIYDGDKLSPEPQDWDYLWQNKQKLSRRITLLDDYREVMGATLKSLGHSYNSTNPQEITQAYEKLRELKPAVTAFTTDAWKERLLAGDLYLAMVYSADAVRLIRENPNQNLKYVIPKSGTSLWSDTMVIPKTSPNPDAAYAWINFMLQPSIAVEVTQRLYFATPNQAAYDQLPSPLRDDTSLFPPPEFLEICERIRPLPPKVIELYDQYWTKLTSN
jgi:spermidine/putrescine transport system substrate-binding protein